MNALTAWGQPPEVFADGSRELTREERVAQIREEIAAEQLERAAHVARINARVIDYLAGDTKAGERIKHARASIANADKCIADLRYELNNLMPGNPPRNDDGN